MAERRPRKLSSPPRDSIQIASGRFMHAADRSGIGLWSLDLSDRTIHLTDQHARMLGHDSAGEAWTFEKFLSHVVDEDRAEFADGFERSVSEGTDWRHECRIMRGDGEVRWIAFAGGSVVDSVGKAVRWVGSAQDITDRVLRERESQQQFRAAVELAPEAIFVRQGESLVYANQAAARLLGFASPDDLIGLAACELVHPDHRDSVVARMKSQDVVSGVSMSAHSHAMLKTDGTVVHVLASSVVCEYKGEPSSMIFVQDVTRLRETLDELRGSEARFRQLVEAAPFAVYICLDDEILYANPAALELFGADSVWALLGHSIFERFVESERDQVRERRRLLLEEGRPTIGVTQSLLRLDGTVAPAVVSVVPTVYEGKRCALVFAQDTTQLTGALHELRGSEERFRVLVDSAPEGIMVQSEGRVLYLNDAMAALMGVTHLSELLGQDWLCRVAPECRPPLEAAMKGGTSLGDHRSFPEVELMRADGSRVPVEISAVPTQFRDEDAVLVFVRDETEQRRADADRTALQQQLFQAQKMESVGLLAGGVAHDYNNILAVQRGYCEIMRSQLRENDPLAKSLAKIESCVDRGAALTRQLLAFSRKQELRPVALDLSELVSGLTGMIGRLIGEDVELVISTSSTPAPVMADPGQLEQVMLNLCVNARDAMPRGGKVEVGVSVVDLADLGERCPRCGEEFTLDRAVMLTVRDNGHGMDDETMRKIFEPFYTTKDRGKGTGLGLSTVFGIVSQSNGHIWVESEVGRGSTFYVVLPYYESQQSGIEADGGGGTDDACAAAEAADATVLVVEDDPALRELVTSMLEGSGMHVFSACDGREALELVSADGLEPDVILTDMVLPDTNGGTLVERLRELAPQAKVIYMSGYAGDDLLRRCDLVPGADLLQKPFTRAGLQQKLKEAIGLTP